MRLRSLLVLTVVLLALTLITGPVRPAGRELGSMEFARVMGVDDNGDGALRVTAGVSAADGKSQNTAVLTAEADTLTLAADELQSDTDRGTFFGFVEHYVLGETAAKGGVRRLLDYMERDLYMRLDTVVYVARGLEAGAVIQAMDGKGEPLADRLAVLQEDVGRMLLPKPVTLREFIVSLDRNGSGLVPALELAEDKGPAGQRGQTGQQGESQVGGTGESARQENAGADSGSAAAGQVVRFAGYGIFAEGRLQGYIETADMLGANLLMQMPLQATMEITGVSGLPAALTLASNSTKVIPVTDGEDLTGLRVECRLTADLAEVQGEENVTENLSFYEEEAARIVRQTLLNVLERAQAMNADFLDLQEAVERAAPDLWLAGLDRRWAEVFPQLKLELEISVKIGRSYESLVQAGGVRE